MLLNVVTNRLNISFTRKKFRSQCLWCHITDERKKTALHTYLRLNSYKIAATNIPNKFRCKQGKCCSELMGRWRCYHKYKNVRYWFWLFFLENVYWHVWWYYLYHKRQSVTTSAYLNRSMYIFQTNALTKASTFSSISINYTSSSFHICRRESSPGLQIHTHFQKMLRHNLFGGFLFPWYHVEEIWCVHFWYFHHSSSHGMWVHISLYWCGWPNIHFTWANEGEKEPSHATAAQFPQRQHLPFS